MTATVGAPAPARDASLALSPAALAFDAVAERFDERFDGWGSVAAQRRAVRASLLAAFAPGANLLELGGGTGDDACWLTERGRHVLLTDPSPTMVGLAARKLSALGAPPPLAVAAESLDRLADARGGAPPFDGAYSNFAALNCVADLSVVARGLARLVRPGGRALLVLFGVVVPGEWLVQLARGDLRAAARRLAHGDVPARLGGRAFTVRYHRRREIVRAFAPWFELRARRGIGVFVPPSAAEPWVTAQPRLLRALERLDALFARPLAPLGDHVLYTLERTATGAPRGGVR